MNDRPAVRLRRWREDDLEALVAAMNDPDIASVRVAERAGFRLEGRSAAGWTCMGAGWIS